MSTLPDVRLAVGEDLPQILALLTDMHSEVGRFPIEWGRVQDLVRRGIATDRAIIGVVGDVYDIQGMVGLNFTEVWYSDTPILEDVFLYTAPEARKTRTAQALLRYSRETAKRLGMPLFISEVFNERTEGKIALYERELGVPLGGYFWVEV